MILVQIQCFNRFSEFTEKVNACNDIKKVLKVAFGWSRIHDKASSSIRKIVAKDVLFPKFVFSVVAFLIEWGILYSENVSLENDYPGGRWAALGVSTSFYTVFLAAMFCAVCCTDIFKHARSYFFLLLLYRILDLELTSILLWLSVKYDEVNTNNIVTHVIFMYTIFKVVVGFVQLCKAFFYISSA